jgi:hypothetical protein
MILQVRGSESRKYTVDLFFRIDAVDADGIAVTALEPEDVLAAVRSHPTGAQ